MSFSVEVIKESHSEGDHFTQTPDATLANLKISPAVVIGDGFVQCLPSPAVHRFAHVFSTPDFTILQVRILKKWRDENESFSFGRRDDDYDPEQYMVQGPSATEVAAHITGKLSDPSSI